MGWHEAALLANAAQAPAHVRDDRSYEQPGGVVYFIQVDSSGADYSGSVPARTTNLNRCFSRPAGPKYVIVSGRVEDSPIKIGTTRTLWRRLAELYHTKIRQPIRLLAVADGSFAEERALHFQFARDRVSLDGGPPGGHSEWFRPTSALVSLIAAAGFPEWLKHDHADWEFRLDRRAMYDALDREWEVRRQQRRQNGKAA